jgi:leucyl-tRNA synthetase
VPSGADATALEKLAREDARVAELIAGKKIHKIVIVPGRMINIVAD